MESVSKDLRRGQDPHVFLFDELLDAGRFRTRLLGPETGSQSSASFAVLLGCELVQD